MYCGAEDGVGGGGAYTGPLGVLMLGLGAEDGIGVCGVAGVYGVN